MLCLQEKFEIIKYPDPENLLNKHSELVSKCQHSIINLKTKQPVNPLASVTNVNECYNYIDDFFSHLP